MKLNELRATPGAMQDAKRIGRGHGSGNGKTAGKGHKGQKARAGHGFRPGFEGGQMPLQRRIPKRGFNNIFDQAALVEAGIIKSACDGVKVLSNGALTKKVTVKANAFSEAAKAKIEAAGGKAEVI